MPRACDQQRTHPVIGLWPIALAGRLAMDMAEHDVRGVHQWLRGQAVREITFDAAHFHNLNTRDELDKATGAFQSHHLERQSHDAAGPNAREQR